MYKNNIYIYTCYILLHHIRLILHTYVTRKCITYMTCIASIYNRLLCSDTCGETVNLAGTGRLA